MVGACRLTDQTGGHGFTLRLHIIQKRQGAIAAWPLFITGNCQNYCAIGWGLLHKINCCRDKSRNARFHVTGPTAIHKPIRHFSAKGRKAPCRLIAHGHDIGVTVEPKAAVGPARTPAGKEIGHATPIHPLAGKSCNRQHLFKQQKRAPLSWRDRGAADQGGR